MATLKLEVPISVYQNIEGETENGTPLFRTEVDVGSDTDITFSHTTTLDTFLDNLIDAHVVYGTNKITPSEKTRVAHVISRLEIALQQARQRLDALVVVPGAKE